MIRSIMLIFHVIFLSFFFSPSLSLRCFPPSKGILPIPAHCRDLANALAYAARLPEHKNPYEWGRRLPVGDHSDLIFELAISLNLSDTSGSAPVKNQLNPQSFHDD